MGKEIKKVIGGTRGDSKEIVTWQAARVARRGTDAVACDIAGVVSRSGAPLSRDRFTSVFLRFPRAQGDLCLWGVGGRRAGFKNKMGARQFSLYRH